MQEGKHEVGIVLIAPSRPSTEYCVGNTEITKVDTELEALLEVLRTESTEVGRDRGF